MPRALVGPQRCYHGWDQRTAAQNSAGVRRLPGAHAHACVCAPMLKCERILSCSAACGSTVMHHKCCDVGTACPLPGGCLCGGVVPSLSARRPAAGQPRAALSRHRQPPPPRRYKARRPPRHESTRCSTSTTPKWSEGSTGASSPLRLGYVAPGMGSVPTISIDPSRHASPLPAGGAGNAGGGRRQKNRSMRVGGNGL